MISRVLEYTKKYYPCTLENTTFTIVSDGITGTFDESYLVGQYVNIQDSVLNDGTYKITAVSDSKLTLDATLLAEESYIYLWGLRLPQGLLSVITDITNYVNSSTSTAEIQSESQGNRSVTYANGSSGWQSVFRSQLAPYKSLYDDRITYTNYNIASKGW